jgi:hypothetical protein
MANDLAVKDNTFKPPSITADKSSGVDIGDEDQVVPRLVLVQPTSQIDGAGKFHLSLNGKLFDSVDCIFVQSQRGRIMFDPDMSKQESICGSDDRIVPAPRFEFPIATECVNCTFSKKFYSEEVMIPGGRKAKQECQMTMIIKAMFIDTLIPFIYTARKTSLFPINSFLTEVLYEYKMTGRPLYCYPVTLKSKLITKANQKYYIPVIERKGTIEKEEFARMVEKITKMDVNAAFEADKVNKPVSDLGEDTPF